MRSSCSSRGGTEDDLATSCASLAAADTSGEARVYIAGGLLIEACASFAVDISGKARIYIAGGLVMEAYASLAADISGEARVYIVGGLFMGGVPPSRPI